MASVDVITCCAAIISIHSTWTFKADHDRADPASGPALVSWHSQFTHCNLCSEPGGDIVHLCTSCPQADITYKRGSALAGFKQLLKDLLDELAPAAVLGDSTLPHLANIDALSIVSDEYRFLVSRITTGATWPEAVLPPSWLAAGVFGYYFDQIPLQHSAIHALANRWMRWSHRASMAVCGNWNDHLPEVELRRLDDAGVTTLQVRHARPHRRRP